MHVTEFLRVSITVSDLQRAERFFRDGFGFTTHEEKTLDDPAWAELMGVPPTTKGHAKRLRLGAQEIGLTAFDPPGRPYPEPRASNDRVFQHFAIVVEDIEAAWSNLQRLSPTPISTQGPVRLPDKTGGVSACKFRDPDGHPLEFLHLPPGVGDPVWQRGAGAQPLGFDHTAIVVEDVDRSISFYSGLLGMRLGGQSLNTGVEQEQMDGLPGCVVDVVGLKPVDVPTPYVELLCYRQPPGRTPTDDIATTDIASTRQVLAVDDLGGILNRLEVAGTRFVSPGIVTLGNGSRAASIRDPDGHMIVLVQ